MGNRQCKEAKVTTTPKGIWNYGLQLLQLQIEDWLNKRPYFSLWSLQGIICGQTFLVRSRSPTSSRKWSGHPCVPWHTQKSQHTPCRCMAQCCCTGMLTQHGQAVGTLPPALRKSWCMGVKPATSIVWCLWDKWLRVNMYWRNVFLNHQRNQVGESWKMNFQIWSVFSKNLS